MQKLLALFEKSSDAAFVIDHDQRIIFWNETAAHLMGYTPQEAAQRKCWELLRGVTKEGCPLCKYICPIVEQVRAGETVHSQDMAIRVKGGAFLPVNFSTIPVPPEWRNGQTPLLIHLLRPLLEPDTQFGRLRLFLLGPLRAQRVDGSFVNGPYWQSAAARGLLVLLAQTGGVPVTGEWLGATLWPDLPVGEAREMVRTAVTHLRLSLEPDLPAPDHSTYVQQSGQGWLLCPDVPLWTDLDHAAAQLKRARLEPNLRCAQAMLEGLLPLFRGEYLADLRETAVWSPAHHATARQLHLATLELLGDLMAQLNQPQEAKKQYLSALMLDPDSQTAYDKLLQLAHPPSSQTISLQKCQRLSHILRCQLTILLETEFRELLTET